MPLGNNFGLIVIFESLEPPKRVLDRLRKFNAVEIGGVWFVPNGGLPSQMLSELQKHLSDSEHSEGVAVIRVWRDESHVCIQGFPSVVEWLQRGRERDR